jgi:predicted transcriptional regulator of viral defense system
MRAEPWSIEKEAGRKSEAFRGFLGQHAMVELATGQHGVLSLPQLKSFGITARGAQSRATAGQLHRIHHGVYSLTPEELLSTRGRYMAAVLACGSGAVISHRSAAAVHGLRATARGKIELTVARRSTLQRPGLEVHRSTTLTAADMTIVDGIPVTTVARTIADLADVLPERAVERALEQATNMEILDGRALADQISRHPRGACLRRLTSHGRIDAPTESVHDERFLALCRSAGVPEPERQIWLDPHDGGPMVRADFLWREQRLVIETDSVRFHGTLSAFESDRRRDQRLILAGWRVIRITWRQVIETPRLVIGLLQNLLPDGG